MDSSFSNIKYGDNSRLESPRARPVNCHMEAARQVRLTDSTEK
jgi:hypothetical protein